jgi:hypothetical protein
MLGHPSKEALHHLEKNTIGTVIIEWNSPTCTAIYKVYTFAKAKHVILHRPGHSEPAIKPFKRVAINIIFFNKGYNNNFYRTHLVCDITSY